MSREASADRNAGASPREAAVGRLVRGRRRWILLGGLLTTGVAALDAAFGSELILIGLLSLGPLVTCLRGTASGTLAVTAYATVLAVLLGVPNEIMGSADHLTRVAVVVLTSLLAVRVASMRAESQARRLRQRRRDLFLVEAGALLDQSLDNEASLEQVARLAVETICDWAFVELIQPDGSIKRVAMAHSDPEREMLVREYDELYPIDPDAPEGSAKVIRTGEPDLIREIPGVMLEAFAVDQKHLALLRELGFRSAMVVPLQARGRILGDLALVSAESGRLYGDDDLFVARKLATRCALAIDNARLYREARESEERLRHQSLHDGLTGLPNRALFLDRLEQALARAERRDSDPALLFCDLDSFKQVNDTHGHLVGDELLRAIPARLNEVIRAEDTISRFGGDEFALLCADLPEPTDVLLVAERLIAQLREPFVVNGIPLQLGASIGIAFAADSQETADSLLRSADAAMYVAKRNGGNQYRVAAESERAAPVPNREEDAAAASEPVGPETTADPV